jgi:hypothetical protein
MTPIDARQLLILSAQADQLARLRERKRITEVEYIGRLNSLRRKCGLPPIQEHSA